MTEYKSNYDVTIVGLGPIGAVLANFLGSYGVGVIVIEKESVTHQLPRAVAFDDEVMRIFQNIGVSKEVNNIVAVGENAHFVKADGEILVTWDRPKKIGSNGWFINYRFHQPDLENILRQRLDTYTNVSIKLESTVVNLEQDENSVEVEVKDAKLGKNIIFKSQYVVGCDGAKSFVRSKIGGNYIDLGFHEPWLVVDLLIKKPESNKVKDSFHYCDPERSSTQVYLGEKRKRWEFRLNPGDDPHKIVEPKNVWSLLSRWIGPSEAELERAVVYTFHASIASQWRKKRLLIAGDAAHLTPPFMGQGMCAGIRDACNLSWKLNEIINKNVGDTLLNSYQTEREAHVRRFIELTIDMGKLINRTRTDLLLGPVKNSIKGPQRISNLLPVLGNGIGKREKDWEGRIFPQAQLESGLLMDDTIGLRWALFSKIKLSENNIKRIEQDFKRLDVRILSDFPEEIYDWMIKKNCEAVLVRPDRYVYGTATTEKEIVCLVSHAIKEIYGQ